MPNRIHLIALVFLFGMLTGCIERSVVIKVNQDKSAVIQVRHFAEQPSSILGNRKADPKKPFAPSRERAEEVAKRLGPGVSLVSLTESSNSSGWPGYNAVFRCEDINDLSLRSEFIDSLVSKKQEAENVDEDSGKKSPLKAFEQIRFEFDGRTLKIVNSATSAPADSDNQPTSDPFAKSDPIPASNVFGDALVQSIVKRLRVGMFVEVEGSIEQTNARHANNQLITLFALDGSKLDSEAIAELTRVRTTHPDYAGKMHSFADRYQGLDFDLQPTITVALK